MPRALITEAEQSSIAGKHSDDRRYEAVSRVRRRINQELAKDVKLLREYHPQLLSELRETVAGEVEECHQVGNWLESNGGVVHRGNTSWSVTKINGQINEVSISDESIQSTEENFAKIETLPDDSVSAGDLIWIHTPDQPREHRFSTILAMGPDSGGEEIRVAEEGLETPYDLFAELVNEDSEKEGPPELSEGVGEDLKTKETIADVERVYDMLQNVNDDEEVAEIKERLNSVVKYLQTDER